MKFMKNGEYSYFSSRDCICLLRVDFQCKINFLANGGMFCNHTEMAKCTKLRIISYFQNSITFEPCKLEGSNKNYDTNAIWYFCPSYLFRFLGHFSWLYLVKKSFWHIIWDIFPRVHSSSCQEHTFWMKIKMYVVTLYIQAKTISQMENVVHF